jgi:hypothetical protein
MITGRRSRLSTTLRRLIVSLNTAQPIISRRTPPFAGGAVYRGYPSINQLSWRRF